MAASSSSSSARVHIGGINDDVPGAGEKTSENENSEDASVLYHCIKSLLYYLRTCRNYRVRSQFNNRAAECARGSSGRAQ